MHMQETRRMHRDASPHAMHQKSRRPDRDANRDHDHASQFLIEHDLRATDSILVAKENRCASIGS
jgi:hypothetical protein